MSTTSKLPSVQAWYANFSTEIQELLEVTDFSVTTWLAFGAAFQLLSLACLPANIAFWLPLVWLMLRVVKSGIDCRRIGKGVFMDVVPGRRTTALGEDGDSRRLFDGSEKATGNKTDDGVVCFVLGARINHPLGKLAPGNVELDRIFKDMWIEAETNRQKWTYLGRTRTLFDIHDTEGITTYWLSYWKSLDGLHQFATSAAHRLGQTSYVSKKFPSVGIMHETYYAPRGCWETVYDNCPPMGMGMASYIVPSSSPEEKTEGVPGGTGKIVSTIRPDPWSSTMFSRMGRGKELKSKNWYGIEEYEGLLATAT